jgi:hypothetical protein
MKRSMKKSAVLAMIAAITIVIAVTTASADPRNSPLLRGTYAFTGSGNCVLHMNGENGGQNLFTIIQIWEGEYTFDGHGSGSFKGTFRAVDLAPGAPNNNAPSKAVASWEFYYEMTDHNRFETWLKPGTYDKVEDPTGIHPTNYFDIKGDRFHGALERDGASIVITSGPPMIHYLCGSDPTVSPYVCTPSGIEGICSESVVGLKVH